MNKKIIIGGVVLIALGVGGYLIYKKIKKPTKKMFDEMVANCKPPCDVFSGLTQSQLDQLFEGYKKLKIDDAQFLIDFYAKNGSTQAEAQRFTALWKEVTKYLKTK